MYSVHFLNAHPYAALNFCLARHFNILEIGARESRIFKAASKENLWISKYMLSKTEKFRRGSQGNHSVALA